VKELAASGDVVFLAVPFGALDEVAANMATSPTASRSWT
jgi:predicted dinucleotide-binding enzyme